MNTLPVHYCDYCDCYPCVCENEEKDVYETYSEFQFWES